MRGTNAFIEQQEAAFGLNNWLWLLALMGSSLCSGVNADEATGEATEVAGPQAIAETTIAETTIEETIVVGAGSLLTRLGDGGSIDVILTEEILRVGATHPSELLNRVAGVWVNRGSGQEHLTAIRSAVFTGSGACGEFSYLEDGISIRPQGFCNINNLFELNTEQAAAVEVWRGPASAVLGGNAMHGSINVLTPTPSGQSISTEFGPYDFYRANISVSADIGEHQVGVGILGTTTDGYRQDTGYEQYKLNLVHTTKWQDWAIKNQLTGTQLHQETGAYVRGFEVYDDADLRRSNPNPEAYRDAWSLRASSQWVQGQLTIHPYLRSSKMEFLQHFLPGQPLENNEQVSGGALVNYVIEADRLTTQVGGQIEFMSGALREYQAEPTTGSAFLVATRPPGLHYDYDVDSTMVAGFYDFEYAVNDISRLIHSLRLEHLAYDYENKHLDGNTKDDGTECGFGGCLYTRPPSGDQSFTNVGARIGYERDISLGLAYASLSRGFRPPQVTELYRLRGGQTLTDLDSEALTSVEVGLKNDRVSVAIFSERTKNLILRDADAYNVSDGRTSSQGIELSVSVPLGAHELSFASTFAVHKYDFTRDVDGRESILKGNDVDSAPRFFGQASWRQQISSALSHELEINKVGSYYLDAANTAEYDGHVNVNWRLSWQLSDRANVGLRVINLLDEKFADRADYAFGSYRYFPALPRQVYLSARYAID